MHCSYWLNSFSGTLNPVSNLAYVITPSDTVNISWTAPFSLNVFDDDMTFCVDIFNATSSTLMYSKCGINTSHHFCELFPKLITCAQYSINVTAVNCAGNGTAQDILAWNGGKFPNVNILVQSHSILIRFW